MQPVCPYPVPHAPRPRPRPSGPTWTAPNSVIPQPDIKHFTVTFTNNVSPDAYKAYLYGVTGDTGAAS